MALPAKKVQIPATYGDYLSWSDDERWEIIEGQAINMGPAPMRRHQGIIREISVCLYNALQERKESPCKLYFSPFDVRLPSGDEADEKIQTVVQPDIVLVCDPSKLDERGCRGAPDLVIEILSPGTLSYDLKVKRDLYEKHGVREYWIVHPEERIVIVYQYSNRSYDKGEVYEKNDHIPLSLLSNFSLSLEKIFEEGI